jgi:effector-binding domain-containing protein
MLETPQITTTDAKLTALIRLTLRREEIRNVMGPGVNEVLAAVRAQEIGPTGPWFTHHLRMDPEVFDFEICMPVSAPVKAVGRVQPGEMPAMKVARTIHCGGYEGLADAWGEFDAWVAANGHKPAGDLWEVYTVGPESGPDSAAWRTELIRPLVA